MLYPEAPNHPMQSYYLTNKGRDALNNLCAHGARNCVKIE